ncbi:MAG: hypothetical protein HYT16_02975 [DPANN group archaeon]|nr:hypothetical protein [DPANN group archaeon]
MGDGTEGVRRAWRRPPVRKADLELILGILPHIFEINPEHHTLRQIARKVRARQAVPTAEERIVEALKNVNDRTGFLKKVEPYYATREDEQRDRPSAWFYERTGDMESARTAIIRCAENNYKTPLFGALPVRKSTTAARSLDDFKP